MKFNNRYLIEQKLKESKYVLGIQTFTDKGLTPTDIQELAFLYAKTPIAKIVGKNMDKGIRVATDLGRLTGKLQTNPKESSGKPALLTFLLKNSLVTKEEYIKLYKILTERHTEAVKFIERAPKSNRGAGAAQAAAKRDMKGEFETENIKL